MTYKKLIQRIVYVSECSCGERAVKDSNPPRERFCKCGKWVPYTEESFIGSELGPEISSRRRHD